MTYCVALKSDNGLIFMSGTRTNAGIDNISVVKKMFTWSEPGDRVITLMTAGNLATTRAVVSLLDERSKAPNKLGHIGVKKVYTTLMRRLVFLSSFKGGLIGLICGPLFLSACSAQYTDTAVNTDVGSTSLCADSYLIALAPDRIGALSWQAGSQLSTADSAMAKHPRLWASREILAQSDIALVTGPGERTFGRKDALALTWGEDFETVLMNATALSEQFGVDISNFKTSFASLSTLPRPDSPPRILYLSRSGGSAGPGTFVDAVITAAGGFNVNDTPGWHTPAIERTLQFDPDLIVTSFFSSNYAGVSDRAVRHSAVRRYLADRPRVEIPGKLWPCAGPGLIEATRQLNAAIIAL